MTEARAIPPQQGDEAQLFERYSERLRRATRLAINTSPDIVDDACAFAWMKLVTNQPRRETAFSWLKEVARNEALRLDRLSRQISELPDEGAHRAGVDVPVAAHRKPEVTQGLLEVRERLGQLPERQRELVFLKAAGWRRADIAERFGISETRVNQVLARASTKMREMDVREHAVTSPRAERLRALEDRPPRYLVAAIGRAPRMDPKRGNEVHRRDWKRLALAIEDFREAHGITDRVVALGRDATVPEHRALTHRIQSYRRGRGLSHGLER